MLKSLPNRLNQACGVGEADAVIVLYGDHPFVSAGSLRRLAKRHLTDRNTLTLMTTTVVSFDGWHSVFQQWGRILRDAYVEAGGVLGEHHPDAVLNVINQVHDAMCQRYLSE